MDKRIGKAGGEKPLLTVRGKQVPHNITQARNLGDGYYCVMDVVSTDESESIVKDLQSIVRKMNEPKRKDRKPAKKTGDEDNAV
jgi:hypothetical protein